MSSPIDPENAHYSDGHDAPPTAVTILLTLTGVIVVLSLVALLVAESLNPGQVNVDDRSIYVLLLLIVSLLGLDQLLDFLPFAGTRYHSPPTELHTYHENMNQYDYADYREEDGYRDDDDDELDDESEP